MIYLDSSAILKLVVPELESAALFEYLDAVEDPLTSSELASVEVHRALRRMESAPGDEHHESADAVLRTAEREMLARRHEAEADARLVTGYGVAPPAREDEAWAELSIEGLQSADLGW